MKVDKRFPVQVGVTLAAGLAIAAIPLMNIGSMHMAISFFAGALLSTANAFAGFWAIEYAWDKPYQTFLKTVFGGLGIRLAAMLGILVLLLVFAELHKVALVVAVLSFYAVYLVLEILYVQQKISEKNQS